MQRTHTTPRRIAAILAAVAGAILLAPAMLGAQQRDRDWEHDRDSRVPRGHMPPPGECRVWYDNRPPGQQPPPTSCAEARRTAARHGGRVIYGERRDDRYDRDGRYERDDRGVWDVVYGREGRNDRRNASMPRMVLGMRYNRGQSLDEVRHWVGSRASRAEYTDRDHNGRPELVTWYDSRGQLLQRWRDSDRDGRADHVTLYHRGQVARVVRG